VRIGYTGVAVYLRSMVTSLISFDSDTQRAGSQVSKFSIGYLVSLFSYLLLDETYQQTLRSIGSSGRVSTTPTTPGNLRVTCDKLTRPSRTMSEKRHRGRLHRRRHGREHERAEPDDSLEG
jgi:hypothetical protein